MYQFLVAIFIYLFAQPADQYINNIGRRIEVHVPNMFQDHCSGNNPLTVPQHVFEQRELFMLQFDQFAAAPGFTGQKIYFKVAKSESGCVTDAPARGKARRHERRGATRASDGANARRARRSRTKSARIAKSAPKSRTLKVPEAGVAAAGRTLMVARPETSVRQRGRRLVSAGVARLRTPHVSTVSLSHNNRTNNCEKEEEEGGHFPKPEGF